MRATRRLRTRHRNPRFTLWRGMRLSLLALLLLGSALLANGCQSSEPRRNPLGETFPTVSGETLAGEEMVLPRDLGPAPAVLLVGYEQNAQFDADRWLLGLLQAETPARLIEVPTIPGFLPGIAAGSIDSGMRSGIPEEDWPSVVTLYGGDAATIEEFTGSEGGNNMRVLLLDDQGVVRWFHDRGYSARELLELDEAVRSMPASGTPR